MPEYLSPGVYVEEVDTGTKPIEATSTSTAGMLGVTERGPANVPILITSSGEFDRWFGGKLARDTYSFSTTGRHCYLPDAIEGFFANGGKRVYVTRVEAEGATHAEMMLHAQNPDSTAAFASTTLLRAAGRGTGLSAEPLVVLDNTNINAPALPALGDILRVGDGSASEYRRATALDPTALPDARVLALTETSLASARATSQITWPVALGGGAPNYAILDPTREGATALSIRADADPTGDVPAPGMSIGVAGSMYRIIGVNPLTELAGNTDFGLLLDRPLGTVSPATTPVDIFIPITYEFEALGGGNVATIVASTPPGAGAAPQVGNRITIGEHSYSVTAVVANAVDPDIRFDVTVTPNPAPPPVAGDPVIVGPPLSMDVVGGATALVASNGAAIAAGAVLLIPDGGAGDPHIVGAPARVTMSAPLPADIEVGERVRVVTIGAPTPAVTPATRNSTAERAAGAPDITLDRRTDLRVGHLLEIGAAPDAEYRTIRGVPARASVGEDPGRIVLDHPLRLAHPTGTGVTVVATTPISVVGSTVESAVAGTTTIAMSNTPADGSVLEIEHTDGTSSLVTVDSSAGINPALVALDAVLATAHGAGEPVIERVQLLGVTALDSGVWGDRLRVAAEHQQVGLVAPTRLVEQVDATHIRLASPVGVEPGTILELLARDGTPTEALLKVAVIDHKDNNLITLADALAPGQQAEIAAAGAANPLSIRSLEFRLTVDLLHQNDAARPRRNELVIASEVFPNLSMDPRHSRYVQKVIGDSDDSAPTRLSDRRSYGESRFVRVRDVAQDDPAHTDLFASRIGPEALVDVLPTGVRRPARLSLDGGDDLIPTINDTTYIGTDNPVPELRTGLQSFRNIDAISIVGCPGRTSNTMQTALINHCEELRYRFAVLDSVGPPEEDTISDVQAQRQNYDTKYAALYYPWLMISEVFPSNLATSNQEPIPPSGHMLGIYARVDIERGVHKAPANEVVRGGVIDLRRTLNKSEHDILNPFPTNINVIRDFRPNNRAIRVYGARVITSDPDWKYVNVRRLLILIEKSIDLGLQWVVFEPNAEPLWARVKRSVSQFLTTVWRNGALEGTDRKEAFFVKCDRSTMTQADIDNGRLIIEVGVAPVKPAEFVIVRIGLFTAHADD